MVISAGHEFPAKAWSPALATSLFCCRNAEGFYATSQNRQQKKRRDIPLPSFRVIEGIPAQEHPSGAETPKNKLIYVW